MPTPGDNGSQAREELIPAWEDKDAYLDNQPPSLLGYQNLGIMPEKQDDFKDDLDELVDFAIQEADVPKTEVMIALKDKIAEMKR